MHHFRYREGELDCEGVRLSAVAREYGTPAYVYSRATIEDHYLRLHEVLGEMDTTICYAVKANSNLAVLRTLSRLGSGFDVVSGGEVERVQASGGSLRKCLFAGVGKSEEEIDRALELGIHAFNVESRAELERLDALARNRGTQAPVSIRVNPDVDAGTHEKITTGTYQNKFGIPFEEVEDLYRWSRSLSGITLRGVHMHIGSQLTTTAPFGAAVRKMLPLVRRLKERLGIEFFSIGGGLGIVYDPALESGLSDWWKGEAAASILTPRSYADLLVPLLAPLDMRILVEPGRFIVGNAGVLLCRVEYIKQVARKNFAIVDAAMNDLLRPSFYGAHHDIVPLRRLEGEIVPTDVVGPICESGDYFCRDRPLPRLAQGDLLAVLSAGAYAFVMASNYNTRPRPAEILVDGTVTGLVRRRETLESLWRDESIPDWLDRDRSGA